MNNKTKFIITYTILLLIALCLMVVTYNADAYKIERCVETFESNASGCKELYGGNE